MRSQRLRRLMYLNLLDKRQYRLFLSLEVALIALPVTSTSSLARGPLSSM